MQQKSKSFEILYNASQRLKNIDIDAEKVFILDSKSGEYIPVGAIAPEEAKDIVKKIKQMRENELSFILSYQAPILDCIKTLTANELKVLMFLAVKSSYGNKVYDLGYNQIAKEARMSKHTVAKAMLKLKESKLVHAKPVKNRFVYTLNPAVFWRGSYYAIKDTMNLFVDKDDS